MSLPKKKIQFLEIDYRIFVCLDRQEKYFEQCCISFKIKLKNLSKIK